MLVFELREGFFVLDGVLVSACGHDRYSTLVEIAERWPQFTIRVAIKFTYRAFTSKTTIRLSRD